MTRSVLPGTVIEPAIKVDRLIFPAVLRGKPASTCCWHGFYQCESSVESKHYDALYNACWLEKINIWVTIITTVIRRPKEGIFQLHQFPIAVIRRRLFCNQQLPNLSLTTSSCPGRIIKLSGSSRNYHLLCPINWSFQMSVGGGHYRLAGICDDCGRLCVSRVVDHKFWYRPIVYMYAAYVLKISLLGLWAK